MTDSKASGAAPVLRPRPLSPHLQVWRWHLTMAASILHRATGVANYVGGLILAGWAASLAQGPAAYSAFMSLLGSIPGKVVLFGLTTSVFYHLANGVRHLALDVGKGLDPKVADLTAVAVAAFAVAAAIVVFVLAMLTGAL